MTKTQNKDQETNPQGGCFPGCFGFSRETVSGQNTASEKKARCCFRSSYDANKSAINTMPVNTAGETEIDKIKNASRSKKWQRKSDGQLSSNHDQSLITANQKLQTQSERDQAPVKKPDERKNIHGQHIILENGEKSLDSSEVPPRDNKYQRRLCRKMKSAVIRTSQPDSPPPDVIRSKGKLSHSVSLPSPAPRKWFGPTTLSEVISKELGGGNNEKFDPVMGMSIILVTLIIMLFWGRLCAILCTSAWLYFYPRLRKHDIDTKAKFSNLNSEEYKKKVVMEGLLERRKHLATS
ncbi:hypothetical protein SLE2022_051770 [Rubroshorea leprosula]